MEKKKEKTKRDWDSRVKEVKRIKDKAQEKRQKNIEKRREKNKEQKTKKLKKKGRIMPGFWKRTQTQFTSNTFMWFAG